VETRALTAIDVATFRSIRLEALRSNPEAFMSTYEVESAFDDATWSERLAGFEGRPGQVFTAECSGEVVGVAGVGWYVEPGETVLWGMYVRGSARGVGAGRMLVQACVDWARSHDADSMTLAVAPDNEAAISLYRRCGFVDVGEFATDPGKRCYRANAMRLMLSGARGV
jgi:ribosomal protein S18 acetylase RimI-like enzyme